jgi:hypothetical protein
MHARKATKGLTLAPAAAAALTGGGLRTSLRGLVGCCAASLGLTSCAPSTLCAAISWPEQAWRR